jgi:hypothetical protein
MTDMGEASLLDDTPPEACVGLDALRWEMAHLLRLVHFLDAEQDEDLCARVVLLEFGTDMLAYAPWAPSLSDLDTLLEEVRAGREACALLERCDARHRAAVILGQALVPRLPPELRERVFDRCEGLPALEATRRALARVRAQREFSQ